MILRDHLFSTCAKFSEKLNISYPLIHTRNFSENIAYVLNEWSKGITELDLSTLIVMRCAIWYHSYNLKNVKNIHGGVLLLVKLQAISPWMLFTFFNLYKWYQIAQHITIKTLEKILQLNLKIDLLLIFSLLYILKMFSPFLPPFA